mmetsp:Transcript_28219/g.70030  ORF Transcript_28219/g.70030 Transcript_28219/m.70030 type:complete len:237 (-) Transcript_28219:359-1069(-)
MHNTRVCIMRTDLQINIAVSALVSDGIPGCLRSSSACRRSSWIERSRKRWIITAARGMNSLYLIIPSGRAFVSAAPIKVDVCNRDSSKSDDWKICLKRDCGSSPVRSWSAYAHRRRSTSAKTGVGRPWAISCLVRISTWISKSTGASSSKLTFPSPLLSAANIRELISRRDSPMSMLRMHVRNSSSSSIPERSTSAFRKKESIALCNSCSGTQVESSSRASSLAREVSSLVCASTC